MCNTPETIFGVSVNLLILLVQSLTLIALLRYVFDTYKNTRAQTYFKIVGDLNHFENQNNTKELKTLIVTHNLNSTELSAWDPRAMELAQDITNRYQIVAHMVERNFLNKYLFFENFSGTMMDVWNTCAYYIMKRRQIFNNTLYLRRDLERLALQAWLYQISIGYETTIKLLNNDNTSILELSSESINIVERRIEEIKRENLFFNSFNFH